MSLSLSLSLSLAHPAPCTIYLSNAHPHTPGTPWYSAPQVYGDYAGDQIKTNLGTVGQPVGEGLAHVVAPVGNVVGGVVKPVMILGDAMNDAPEWGPEVEGSARDVAGEWAGKGMETLKEGKQAAEGATGGGKEA